MIIDFNKYNNPEMPSIVLCTPNMDRIAQIDSLIYETNISLKYNAISEFSFKIPKYINKENIINAYDLIKAKKLIYIENVGCFIIQDIQEYNDGISQILNVNCFSLEAELLYKRISLLDILSMPLKQSFFIDKIESGSPILFYKSSHSLINGQQIILTTEGELLSPLSNKGTYYVVNSNIEKGTFQLSLTFNGSPIESTSTNQSGTVKASLGIIDKLLIQYIPNWDYAKDESGFEVPLPESLSSLYRSFKFSGSTTIYEFLTTQIESAFNCIIVFNRINRTFYIDSANESNDNNKNTDIVISYDNLINSSSFTEYSDELATAIGCYGGEGLDIRRVNPLGNNYIYNFEYYKKPKWMSYDLISKIDYWNNLLLSQEENISLEDSNKNSQYLLSLKNSCKEYYEYYFTYNKRQEEINKQQFLLDEITTNETADKKLRSYYYTNIKYLKSGNKESSVPTKTTIDVPNYQYYYNQSIEIPKKYQLKNIFLWSVYGSLDNINSIITQNGTTTNQFIDKINLNVSKIENINEFPIKYSKKIESLSNSYYEIGNLEIYYYNIINLYVKEESLLKVSIYENSQIDIDDHNVNMNFLLNGTNNPLDKPSVSNGKIRNQNNEIKESELIDLGFLSGIKTDAEEESVGYGGINLTKILINSIKETNIDSSDIFNSESYITILLSILKKISISLDLKTNMGEKYEELVPFIIENTYQNKNIIKTSIMSENEIINQSSYLYQQSKEILKKASVPRYEFSANITNFINLIDYKTTFTKELELGKKIRILLDSKLIIALLLEINFSFDNLNQMELIFSNRLRLDNQYFQYYDLLNISAKIGGSVSSEKVTWSDWSTNYKTDVTDFISSALNAKNNEIINSNNEEISIGDYGIRGRKKLEDEGYSSEEMWITNNIIGFTDDGWDTTKSFLGKTTVSGSSKSSYGIVAESIIGKIIAGSNLTIETSGENELGDPIFQIQSNKIKISNMDFRVTKQNPEDGKFTTIKINPLEGMKIGRTNSYGNEFEDVSFSIDSNGNIVMKDLNVTSAGAFTIDSNGLSFNRISNGISYFNYIYPESMFLGTDTTKTYVGIRSKDYPNSIHIGPTGKGITIPLSDGNLVFEVPGDKLFQSLKIFLPGTTDLAGRIRVVQDVSTSQYLIKDVYTGFIYDGKSKSDGGITSLINTATVTTTDEYKIVGGLFFRITA